MHKRDKQKILDYPSLADAVQTMESMAFLKGRMILRYIVGSHID